MTVREPQTAEEEFYSNGTLPDVADPGPGVGPERRRTRRGAPAPARKPDYRLRGLDLEAPGFTEVKPGPVRKAHPSHRRWRRRRVMQWLAALIILAATAVALRVSVIQPYSVQTTSMVPTLKPGTDVLVVRPEVLTGPVKVGEIVVFRRPQGFTCSSAADNSRDLVKRVIGLPGQTIWSVDDRIYVNGHALDESGWYNPPFGELGTSDIARTVIPAGTYFVMGDNRTDPCDSRSFGPIAGSSLVGKVVATTTRDGHPSVHIL